MRRARYQYGTVELSPRSRGPAVWVYRWRERGPQGKSIRKSAVIGTAEEYTTKAQALRAAEEHRLQANREGGGTSEPTFGVLIERFIVAERLRDAKPALRIEVNCGGGSFKSQLKRADKSGAAVALVLGDTETEKRVVGLKSLRIESPQVEVPWDAVAAELDARLAQLRS